MQRRQLLSGTALVAASSLFILGSAIAQTAPAVAPPTTTGSAASVAQLGEVVVTARARTEKLLDVPVSVQSFSAAQLKQDNIVNIDDLQCGRIHFQ